MSLPFMQPYLGLSNSLQTAQAGGGAWDWDDDFISYADDTAFAVVYPTTDSGEMKGQAASNDILVNQNGAVASNNDVLYRDFGSNLDDTAWVLRQAINLTVLTLTNAPYYSAMHYGLYSSTGNSGVTQDYIGTTIYSRTGVSAWYAYTTDGGGVNTPYLGTAFARTLTPEMMYNEVIRLTATTFTNEFFSDSGYSSSLEKESPTVASTVNSLRYWGTKSYDNALQGQISSTVDPNLQLADGVTVAP